MHILNVFVNFATNYNGVTEKIMQVIHTPDFGSPMKLGRTAQKEASKILVNVDKPILSDCQLQNICELADALGISRNDIKPMSFLDADQGASNPTRDQNNCQSCVVSFAARRRGLNCIAKAYDSCNAAMYNLGEQFQNAWINPKTGKILHPTIIRGKSDDDVISKLKILLSKEGEYILGFNGNDGIGHVVNVITIDGKIVIHDEQISKESDRYTTIDSFSDIDYFEVIKIDKAILNIDVVQHVLETL